MTAYTLAYMFFYAMTKTADRHTEQAMLVYPLRFPEEHLRAISKIAKKEDRTRQALIRQAVSEFLERRAE